MPPAAKVLELERLVLSLEPTLPVFDAQPMVRAIDTLNGLLIFQLGAVLVGTLGGLGLVLSVIGVTEFCLIPSADADRRLRYALPWGQSPGR